MEKVDSLPGRKLDGIPELIVGEEDVAVGVRHMRSEVEPASARLFLPSASWASASAPASRVGVDMIRSGFIIRWCCCVSPASWSTSSVVVLVVDLDVGLRAHC